MRKATEDSLSQFYFTSVFDSLLQLYIDTPVIFDTTYFVTGISDISPVKIQMFSESGCDNKIFTRPEWLINFSTAEYDYLMSLESKTDADYAAFMANNEIVGEWYKVFESKKKHVMLLQQLGTDINVNWGDVVTETYYLDNKPVLFRNRECFKFTKTGIIRRFLWDTKLIEEHRFIFANGKMIKKVIKHNAK